MSVREYLATLHGDVIVSTPDVTLIVEAYIAWIILDCKGRPVNAVNLELMTQVETILQTIDELISKDKIQLVVITSGKKNTFVAGADIHAMYPITDEKAAAEASRAGQNIFNRIESLRIPTLAAVNGPCLGAGLELALACTYRVAATGRHVQLGLPEVKLGLLPGAGGTVRLPRVVGLSRALEIILPGGSVASTKALKYGIVDRVIDGEDHLPHQHRFYTGVRSYAISLFGKSSQRGSSTIKNDRGFKEKMLDETRLGQYVVARTAAQNLDKQAKGKYPAPYVALDTVMQNINLNVKQGLEVEAKSFGRLSVTPQCKALMSLFFMTTDTKQQKVTAKPIKIKKIGVIGAGVMGAQIAAIAASKNIPVYIRDISPELVSKGLKHVEDTFMARVKKGRLPESKARQYISLVTGGTDVTGFASCQLLIEAAVERMDLKKRILTEIESVCSSDTIFATNTSSLSITELATVSKNPGNVVGLHFFNPVNKMPLVEVIRGTHTSDVAVATSYQLALQLGKFPVVCGDCPGFVVNRILGIYMNEAGILAMEGASLTEVDAALLSFGMPMGPFRLMDEVGLDVAAHVGPILEQGLGKRYAQIPSFAKLLHDNPKTLGKKTGSGFYTYTGEKQGPLNPQLLDQLTRLIKPSKHVATQKDMIDRCVLLMLNEAAMILDEKMVATPAELDLAMVMGTGFAPFTGGLLAYADARGVDVIVTRLQELEKRLGMHFHPAPLLVKKAEALKAGDRTAGRFFPERPDPKQLRPITSVPRSKL